MPSKSKRVGHRGLGDTVAAVTRVTGVDKVVKAVVRGVGAKDCGCKKRQERLNELVPYGKNNQDET